MRVFCLSPSQVAVTWDDYSQLLEHAERELGEAQASEIRAGAVASRCQIWGVQDEKGVQGVCITEIQQIARGRICLVRVAVGHAPLKEQRKLLAEIGRWARKEQRCIAVRFIGRRGWLRRFRQFRQTAVVAEWNLRAN